MKVYTYSEARQHLSSVLEEARREGGVRIRRRDGQVFEVRPEQSKSSPLDVQALDLGFSRKEIIDFIRTGRKPTKRANKALQPSPPSAVPSRKKRAPRRG